MKIQKKQQRVAKTMEEGDRGHDLGYIFGTNGGGSQSTCRWTLGGRLQGLGSTALCRNSEETIF